jgi:hypothetical protein
MWLPVVPCSEGEPFLVLTGEEWERGLTLTNPLEIKLENWEFDGERRKVDVVGTVVNAGTASAMVIVFVNLADSFSPSAQPHTCTLEPGTSCQFAIALTFSVPYGGSVVAPTGKVIAEVERSMCWKNARGKRVEQSIIFSADSSGDFPVSVRHFPYYINLY